MKGKVAKATEYWFIVLILAAIVAFFIPKYSSIRKETNIDTINSLKNSIEHASILVHTIVENKSVVINNDVIVINAATGQQTKIDHLNHYPLADSITGITKALEGYDGFTASGIDPVVFTLNSAPSPSRCSVIYNLKSNDKPYISTITSGC